MSSKTTRPACYSAGTGTWLPLMRRTAPDLLATAKTQRRDPAAQFTAGADIQLAPARRIWW